jgi:hypothetical protein
MLRQYIAIQYAYSKIGQILISIPNTTFGIRHGKKSKVSSKIPGTFNDY